MPVFEERLKKGLARLPRPQESDEARSPWLTILLDAYYILTIGTALAQTDEEIRRGIPLACGAGCASCCLRPEVPISKLELLGIWWYVTEKLTAKDRASLIERLLHRHESYACPFLAEAQCVIYPLRPLACRFLHVFGAPCKTDEIPVDTRPRDIWIPQEAVSPAVLTMLPFFGFTTEEACHQALAEGYLVSVSTLMSDIPWEVLITAKRK